MLRLAPPFAILILIGPILFGLAATLLPAFGYFPTLGSTDFSLEPFQQLFARPGIKQSILISLISGLATTVIAVASVAFFIAGWSSTPSFRRFQQFVSPLLSVPHAAAAFGLAFLIAPSGWLMRLLSPWFTGMERPPDWLILQDSWGLTMMAGLIVKEIPFLFLVTLAALPQTDLRRNFHMTTAMGYGRVAGFMHTVWPRIYKQIRLAVFAVIAYSASVVDVAIILGPDSPAPLSPRLLGWMNGPDIHLRFEASAGAIVQLAVIIFAMVIWLAGENLLAYVRVQLASRGFRLARDRALRIVAITWISLTTTTVFLSLAILALWSVAGFWSFPDALPDTFTTKNWARSLPGMGVPLQNSLTIAAIATLAALVIALACLEREARSNATKYNALLVIYLPLLIPQTSFVFGLQLFFLWLGLDATFAALILVHMVFVLPYIFLSLSDPWRAWDKRYEAIANGMGAGANRIFWRIRLPMLMRAILIAAAVGFSVSIAQYLPTILIGAGRIPTITTEAVALAAGGDRRIIGTYAFLQLMLPLSGFLFAALVPALLFKNRQDMKLS